MFIRNAWYVACESTALDNHTPLGRTICDQPMVFFRDADGTAVALEDFCPHRGTPLSLGRVENGALVCGYHGLTMGCQGKTLHMPGQRPKVFPAIQSYAVLERYGFVWVWPGQQQHADAMELPDFPYLQQDSWAYGGGLFHVQADYRLMIDNLMDLTHETYVHATSIGQPEIDETPCHTEVEGERVTTSRFMSAIQAPSFWQQAMTAHGLDPQATVDRWQICRFMAPSHVQIDVGVALHGLGGIHAPADKKVQAVVVDFITPETATSHWYHWGMARHFQVGDQALTDAIRKGQEKIFSEDLAILERQQKSLTTHAGRRLVTLDIDAGGARARRIIAKRIEAEATPMSQTSTNEHAPEHV
ncbi:MAG: Rieske 2Fe-2S domain-containing protein [Burkholderiaceae bacterium]